MNTSLFRFIKRSPSPYHAVAESARMLDAAGFSRLEESRPWSITPGASYYVTRNASTLIAFRVPSAECTSVMLAAAHSDSPTFKLRENAERVDANYVRLSTERYGGAILPSWMDRPLSVAGRVFVRAPGGIECRLVDLCDAAAIIPNVAIHMDRSVNDSKKYDAAVDMVPLYGAASTAGSFRERIAESCRARSEDIISSDLSLYVPDDGIEWGDFISAPRLDDLQCAFAALRAFIDADENESLNMYCLFDNEEVGSRTKQGADSTMLRDVIERVGESLGQSKDETMSMIASGLMLSCDNAHAIHPNHPEYSDAAATARMNAGVVIKHSASQSYASDALSAGLFRMICEDVGIPVQNFVNRPDMPGGSTLGNISQSHLSIPTADIGLAQLAMHSAFETAGADDTAYMVKALTAFFSRSVKCFADGIFQIG